MATTKSAARSAAPRTTSVTTHSHMELEDKVVALEGQLASAIAAVAALKARVAACESVPPPAASGRDEDLREQLRVYFSTSVNRKVETRLPKI